MRNRLEFESEGQWRALASIVWSEARAVRFPRRFAKVDSWHARWFDDLAAFLSGSPDFYPSIEEIASRASTESEGSLKALCSSGVFTQGFEIRCGACGQRTIYSVETLTSKPACSVCRRQTQLPVRFDWNFYFDVFLAESIREHGILPQIWALGALQEQARDCFMYVPPQGLLLSENGREAEIDLLCIVDGKLVVGEVKPRARDFTPGDRESLCELARALDPDIVTLACMEEESVALKVVR